VVYHPTSTAEMNAHEAGAEAAIRRFRDFVRIRSISGEGPNGSYQEAVAFLKEIAAPLGHCEELEYVENKPVLLVTIPGKRPDLKAILLQSHYDVVPCDEEYWKVDPFEAVMTESGDIFGRGTQDMKSVCMQYLESLHNLNSRNVQLDRTIYLVFCPDEEIGGRDAAGYFAGAYTNAKSNGMKCLHKLDPQPGVVLDEGLAHPENKARVFYGERGIWWLRIMAEGNVGHGSRFILDTAISKLITVVNRLLKFRAEEEARLVAAAQAGHSCNHGDALTLGDVTTVNLTMLKGGVTTDGGKTWNLNCIPREAEAGFDIRVSPRLGMKKMTDKLDEWLKDVAGVTYESIYKNSSTKSSINPEEYWWSKMSAAFDAAGVTVDKEIFSAGTDARYYRHCGLPSYGFSPLINTPVLLHDHNEFVNKDVFLNGIKIYEDILVSLGTERDLNCKL